MSMEPQELPRPRFQRPAVSPLPSTLFSQEPALAEQRAL